MIGTKLAHYEITTHLGSGGMGEVYQATDTKLGRSVAIKFLPEAFSHDTERVARFQREARVLASLNHSNIAAIYGVEESHERKFLVMELVAGETLADRVKHGAIPVEDALELARQIAEALEAAHERDIVHRDLKPANIKITPQGKLKVLDFGLAKAVRAEGVDPATSHSPTMMSGTVAGVILGTAAYMSPEQARGRAVDKRTDNWAFGCVLFEMLTGKQAFDGEDVTDVIAKIVRGEPMWEALPASTPAKIRQLLQRCLTKDPSRRLRDIGDGRIEIEEAQRATAEPETKAPSKARHRWAAPAALTLILLVAGVFGWMGRSSNSALPAASAIRFPINAPKGWRVLEAASAQEIAISPDGKHLAFTVESGTGFFLTGSSHIAIRSIDSLDAETLAGAEGGRSPFWSPDGRFLAFGAGGKLKRIELASGQVQIICDAPNLLQATWGSSGTIIFGGDDTGLFRVSATGGTPDAVTTPDTSRGEIAHMYPEFLPDGIHFLYSVFHPPDKMAANLAALGSKDIQPILVSDSAVKYAAAHLFFVRSGKLMAQRFDERKLELVGEAQLVAETVWVNPMVNYPGFGASPDAVSFGIGTIPETQLVWLDRTGKETGTVGAPDRYLSVSLSPKETQIATLRFDTQSRSFAIWLIDSRTGNPSRFTFERVVANGIWAPNADSIIYSEDLVAIKRKLVNGGTDAEVLLKTSSGMSPWSWSKDGRYLAYQDRSSIMGSDIGLVSLSGDKKPTPILKERFNETAPQISPNSNWIAYASDETGRFEIFVRSFPKLEGKWQISVNGGVNPKWRQDGKEIFFLSPSGDLMAVDVDGAATTFQKGSPKALFRLAGSRSQATDGYQYDVAQNGQRFLFNKVLESSEPPMITVISNWQALLR